MVPFVHVDQDVTFPMPRGDALDNYVVYVGFDPRAAPAKPERKQKKRSSSFMARKAKTRRLRSARKRARCPAKAGPSKSRSREGGFRARE